VRQQLEAIDKKFDEACNNKNPHDRSPDKVRANLTRSRRMGSG